MPGEVTALTHRGRIAWWSQEGDVLEALVERVGAVVASGWTAVAPLHRLGQALLADLAGDDDAVLAALDGIPQDVDDAWLRSTAAWLRSVVLGGMGDIAGSLAALDGVTSTDPGLEQAIAQSRALGHRALGDLTTYQEAAARIVTAIQTAGVERNILEYAAHTARSCANVGDMVGARRYLDAARRRRGMESGTRPSDYSSQRPLWRWRRARRAKQPRRSDLATRSRNLWAASAGRGGTISR